MTLLDYLPSLRGALSPRLDHAVWPSTTHYRHGRVTVAGMFLDDIADRYSTPVCVIDETSLRGRCNRIALGSCTAEMLYKPGSVLAPIVARWIGEQHLTLVVDSMAALSSARKLGVDPSHIVGRAQSAQAADLLLSLPAGERVGRLVVAAGIHRVPDADRAVALAQSTLVSTDGNRDYAENVIAQVVDCPATVFDGVECSASTLDGVFARIVESLGVMAQAYRDHGVLGNRLHLRIDSPTGLDTSLLSDVVEDAVDEGCIRHRFPRPQLAVETGESITDAAVVTVCRVRSIDRTDSQRAVVVLDGGTGCAPAAAVIANRHSLGGEELFVLADGSDPRHRCVIHSEVSLPADVRVGDVLAIVDGPGDCPSVLTLSDGQAHHLDMLPAQAVRFIPRVGTPFPSR
ncbi:diaminopimelate decarboxylase [Rhodococcus sp. 06-235-1A]|uniref:diaminopimelate decarboxylase n=1 Tax=Rhodococcus sp. 06-235-1A TaxID=2022508 RepID=UPI001179F3CD|nr:diaminopimelate decarboxylase [Rhodococcus sp. 06-235-1A]